MMTDQADIWAGNTIAFMAHLESLADPAAIDNLELLREAVVALKEFEDGYESLARYAGLTDNPDREVAISTASAIASRIRHHRDRYSRRLLALTPAGGRMN